MSTVEGLLLFAVIGALTFVMRLSFIALLGRLRLPDWSRDALRYVPVAAISALIWPELLTAGDGVLTPTTYPRILAGSVSIVVALVSRNVLVTLAAGMAALWLAQWGLGR
jgi:branched-subunit amino acid transport protein